jgi:FtsH-binding integral membrane protein
MQPELQPVPANVPASSQERALQQHRVLRNTYLLLAATLIPTAIGAVIGTNINVSFLRSSPIISFFVILGIFYGWIFAIERNRDSGLGVALLLGFTLFMGLLLGPLFQQILGLRNGGQLIMLAAGGTAAVFFALSAVAYSTTRDFSGLGNFLMVGVIVVMLAVVANASSHSMFHQIVAAFILSRRCDPLADQRDRARRRDELRLGHADALRRSLQPVHEPAATARDLWRRPRLIPSSIRQRAALAALFVCSLLKGG